MFAQGLLDPAVIAWLFPRLSAAGRDVGDPVIAVAT
jgi:hypothetical protein